MKNYTSRTAAKAEAARRTAATGTPHKVVTSLRGKKAPVYNVVRNPFAVNTI